jgi:hypothetical protein
MKFEVEFPHCVRNVKEKNILLFKFCCNIFIGVRINKEMPGSVASGTLCSCLVVCWSQGNSLEISHCAQLHYFSLTYLNISHIKRRF